jgi:hypothetical protein
VTEDQLTAIFYAKKIKPADPRPFWKRLFVSLRIDIKPSKSTDKPVSYVGIRARSDF